MTPTFELVHRLGSGGMADVWLSRMTTEQGVQLVALKRMRPELDELPDARLRLLREAELGARLHHPQVVKVLAVGEDAEGLYIAFEFVEGLNALKLLRRAASERRALSLGVVLCLARDLAAAVAYAHGSPLPGGGQVLHRDISADNLLVGTDGWARLSDFGVAVATEMTRMTRTGHVSGKIGHIAPELIEGGAAAAASDVYAMGVCLFQLFTGVRPFTGENDAQVLRAMMFTDAPRLSALRPDVPPKVAEWVDLALRRAPGERPSAQDLLERVDGAKVALARSELAAEVIAATSAASAPALLARPAAPVSRPATVSLRQDGPTLARRWALLMGVAAAVVLVGAATLKWRTRAALRPIALGPEVVSVPDAGLAEPASPAPVDEVDAGVAPPSLAGREARDAGPAVKPSAPTSRRVARKQTLLALKVVPYAEVFLDGELLGVTPLNPVPLSPGEHALLLVNNAMKVRRTQRFTAVEGKTAKLEVNLNQP